MPITFRKSIRATRWLKFNINRRSWSWTVGSGNGPRYTHSSTGRHTWSQNLPGGWGYRKTTSRRSRGDN